MKEKRFCGFDTKYIKKNHFNLLMTLSQFINTLLVNWDSLSMVNWVIKVSVMGKNMEGWSPFLHTLMFEQGFTDLLCFLHANANCYHTKIASSDKNRNNSSDNFRLTDTMTIIFQKRAEEKRGKEQMDGAETVDWGQDETKHKEEQRWSHDNNWTKNVLLCKPEGQEQIFMKVHLFKPRIVVLCDFVLSPVLIILFSNAPALIEWQ